MAAASERRLGKVLSVLNAMDIWAMTLSSVRRENPEVEAPVDVRRHLQEYGND